MELVAVEPKSRQWSVLLWQVHVTFQIISVLSFHLPCLFFFTIHITVSYTNGISACFPPLCLSLAQTDLIPTEINVVHFSEYTLTLKEQDIMGHSANGWLSLDTKRHVHSSLCTSLSQHSIHCIPEMIAKGFQPCFEGSFGVSVRGTDVSWLFAASHTHSHIVQVL